VLFLPLAKTTLFNAHPKSFDIDTEWPTSLIGGEEPGGSDFVVKGIK